MLKRMSVITAFLLSAVSMFAYSPAINDVDVRVRLYPQDGSAVVTENWDVTVASGTEWYLTRYNLGNADIEQLSVSDENGMFDYIGRWDINASIEQKAGKCGLNPTAGGYEICWGVGTYGPHRYTVKYTISNAVDILDDADVFHFQLVSPGLSSTPKHVKARIEVNGTQLDTANVLFWGFGYEGTTSIEDGGLCFESDKFSRNSSMITLARFDSGTFAEGSRVDRDFQSVLDRAMEGADFGTDEKHESKAEKGLIVFFMLIFAAVCALPVFLTEKARGLSRKKILGAKIKDVTWSRDIPYSGSVLDTNYTMGKLGVTETNKNLASALMLRMIYKGVLEVRKNADGKTVDFAIVPEADRSYMEEEEIRFFDMVESASGEDKILQNKEFSKWAKNNCKKLYNWTASLPGAAVGNLKTRGELDKSMKYTPAGQAEARKAYGFKLFLEDFTNMEEKHSVEAVLWQEYMVFAALFGIADKVAKEMKDIDPDVFRNMMPADDWTSVFTATNTFGRHFYTGVNLGKPAPVNNGGNGPTHTGSWGGHGGFSSMGGGGGFHGGGFGGGSR